MTRCATQRFALEPAIPSTVRMAIYRSTKTKKSTQKIKFERLSPELPNITIPSTYSSEPMEYSVDFRLDNDDNLEFQFEIKMTPGKAVAWKIMNAKDISVGIISNCPLDLLSKIQGVCLIDSFGNMVDIDEEGSVNFQIPVITASFHKPRSQDSIAIAQNSELDDDSYHDDVGGSRRSERNNKRKRGEEMVCRTIIDLRSRGNIDLDNRKLITFI